MTDIRNGLNTGSITQLPSSGSLDVFTHSDHDPRTLVTRAGDSLRHRNPPITLHKVTATKTNLISRLDRNFESGAYISDIHNPVTLSLSSKSPAPGVGTG